jgi:hypothetical protein
MIYGRFPEFFYKILALLRTFWFILWARNPTVDEKNIQQSRRESAEWFRAEHADAFVISNSSAEVDRAMNHMVARGRNDLIETDIVQFQHFKNPAEWERLEVLNAYLGVDFCVRLAHVDQFNQSAGRNCGFRGDRGKKHWVVVSPSLWPLLQGVMRQFSRYGLALSQTAQQAKDQKRAA